MSAFARAWRSGFFVMAVFCVLLLTVAAWAQDHPVPRGEVFVGYSWLNPGGDTPIGHLKSLNKGIGTSATINLAKHIGLEGQFATHWSDQINADTLMFGPKVFGRIENGPVLYLHGLGGWYHFSPAGLLPSNNSVGGMFGGGMDLPIGSHFSWRVFEADYVLGRPNYSSVLSRFPLINDRNIFHPKLDGEQLMTGLVFNFGSLGPPPTPPSMACSAQPTEVFAGDPITVTATPSNFNPKHTVTYGWTATGGKVTGNNTTAQVDTTGLAPGSYTVTAKGSDAKAKPPYAEASCNANFTIKEKPKHPPTVSCSANPTTVQAGTPSTITCSCSSPDNAQVTTEYSASGGKVSGTGNTATLDTAGASAGPITVTAKCTDDRGLNSSADTSVTVENPPPPPTASKMSECDFPNKVKPWRVDNTCKAVLDDVALRLQQQSDAKLVIVGEQTPKERRKNLAAERAVDAKAYLSGGEAKQQIDPSRIETRTGTGGETKAEFWLVPAGANFTEEGTTPVDENKVKPIPDHPHKAPAKKGAKKAKPAA